MAETVVPVQDTQPVDTRIADRAAEHKEIVRQRKIGNLAKARVEKKRLERLKAMVVEKVKMNEPISDSERAMLDWNPSRSRPETVAQREALTIAKAAKLLIKPQHVSELRVLVERTAAKYSYNPIEALIQLTQPKEDIDGEEKYQVCVEDRISIHKALLPFLVPTIQVPRGRAAGQEEPEGIKVTITQFQMPRKEPGQVLHAAPPVMVQIETTPPDPHAKPNLAPRL